MKACTVLLELFKVSYEWSAPRLRSQAWQLRDELKGRGKRFETYEVEDALPGLARELLPDSPAAQWDAEWAHELCTDALAHFAKAYAELSDADKEVLDFSAQHVWDERMHDAGLANDPVAFRVALKGWTQAGLEAMEQLRIKGGAA
jgi:hypothetical protein